jgi:hypothetical protein
MGGSGVKRMTSVLVSVVLASAGGLGLAGCGGDSEEEAVPFESPEGRFRVDFPGKPDRQEQSEPSAGQSLKIVLFTVDAGDKAYSVAFSDLPAQVSQVSPETVLGGVPEGSAGRVPGKVRSKNMSTFVGSPAIDYVIDGEGASQGATVQAKAVLVGARLYIIQGAGQNTETPFYQQMLSSFRLLPAG